MDSDDVKRLFIATAGSCLLALANGYRQYFVAVTASTILKSSACAPVQPRPVVQLANLFNDVNSGEPFFAGIIT
jgi:hypothetical protein